MFIKNLVTIAIVVTAFFASTSFAATGTSTSPTFQVKITIVSACVFAAGSGSDINFGSVAANTTTTDASLQKSDNISVTCSKGTPYIVGLATTAGNAGTGSMAGTGSNTDKVPYSLYQNSAYTTVWGNTGTSVAAPGNDYVGTGSGAAQSLPVYAKVTNPNFTPDNYADTVTVSVTF